MMLHKKDILELNDGRKMEIIDLIGSGGQGEVYLVGIDNKKYAFKLYKDLPSENFIYNLKNNAIKGSPSSSFLWPLEIVENEESDEVGYIMDLRPQEYKSFVSFLTGKNKFKNTLAMLDWCIELCLAFKKLHEKGAILFEFSGNQKQIIQNINTSNIIYSGAFIKAANFLECKQYLESEYKPYGLLRSRDQFETDEAYNIHVNGFNNFDYSNQITNMIQNYNQIKTQSDDLLENAKIRMVIYIFILFIFIIVFNFILGKRDSEQNMLKKIFKEGINVKFINKYYNYSIIIECLVTLALVFLAFFISKTLITNYLNADFYYRYMLLSFAGLLFSLVISFFINRIYIKALINRIKESIKKQIEELQNVKFN